MACCTVVLSDTGTYQHVDGVELANPLKRLCAVGSVERGEVAPARLLAVPKRTMPVRVKVRMTRSRGSAHAHPTCEAVLRAVRWSISPRSAPVGAWRRT